MGLKVYLDGKLVEKGRAKVSIFDHGLLYGDGVFEGIRVYDGLIFKLKEHIDRLFRSAKAIELKIPMPEKELVKAIIKTLRANKLKDAYIRLVVTRGQGDLGLDPRKCKKPTVFIIADKIALYPARFYEKGLRIITAKTRRNAPSALNPRIKSLNYLNNILAKIEAVKARSPEALMLTVDGCVAECTGDNIFIVKKGRLSTPLVRVGTLDGITRSAVMGLAKKAGIECVEALLTRADLFDAQECFLTGTAAEIVPVVKIDGRVVGTGRPGKITLRLLKAFRELTKIDGVKY